MTENPKALPAEYSLPEEQEAEQKAEQEIAQEIMEQKMAEKHRGFLIECMKENLNHARHVENERMLFVSLFAALTGGLLAAVSQVSAGLVSAILMVLLSLNIVCLFLVIRWNKVFTAHMNRAEKIYLQVLDPQSIGWDMPADHYYYFNHKRNVKHQKPYAKTGLLFIFYNCAVMAVLGILLIYWLAA